VRNVNSSSRNHIISAASCSVNFKFLWKLRKSPTIG
jgi:hypothetical protein